MANEKPETIEALRAERDEAVARLERVLDAIAAELGIRDLRREKGSRVLVDEIIALRRYAYQRGYMDRRRDDEKD